MNTIRSGNGSSYEIYKGAKFIVEKGDINNYFSGAKIITIDKDKISWFWSNERGTMLARFHDGATYGTTLIPCIPKKIEEYL